MDAADIKIMNEYFEAVDEDIDGQLYVPTPEEALEEARQSEDRGIPAYIDGVRVGPTPKPAARPPVELLINHKAQPDPQRVPTRKSEETLQEFSDRLDREQKNQKHEWSEVSFIFASHLICTCGTEARSDEEVDKHNEEVKRRKSKKPFERPEHLTQRPFVASEELRALQKQLHQESAKR